VGKLSRLEAHGVDNVVTLRKSVLERGAVYRETVEPFGIHAVDILPRPARRAALEADVVEQQPTVHGYGVPERTAVEIDHLLHRSVQEVGQGNHGRVRRSEDGDSGTVQRQFRQLFGVKGDIYRDLLQIWIGEFSGSGTHREDHLL
jgi:hypothetical protein